MKLAWLTDYFGILRIFFASVELPRRRKITFAGSAITSVTDNPDNNSTDVLIDGGGSGTRGQVVVTADANHTLSPTEAAVAIVKATGARTVDRQLVYPAPATNADAYTRVLRVDTTGDGKTIATIGAGGTVLVPTGSSLTLGFDPDGVFVVNTGAP